MIPSDHFVRFYNEVFKFLAEQDGLQEYYKEISRHQELHCLELFTQRGLAGVYEYYQKSRREENCDLDLEFRDGGLRLYMRKCPSLSKAIDNDAGCCPKYCEHCPGWTMPLYRKAKLYQIFDLLDPGLPQCEEWIFEELEPAQAKLRQYADRPNIFYNWQD